MDLDPPGIFVETPFIPPHSQWPEPMDLDPPGIYVAIDYGCLSYDKHDYDAKPLHPLV
ncbi:8905_t:CDS:2 [Funneliformis geosporum]|uniref:8905_t:CDS:1 n=1 Tax=Funneliformis geosporum TaxID=1117311 RepID=A0A9W4SNM2_9GLOM|nr:8905_t:CDS:2 [Funneliformis geosporum]